MPASCSLRRRSLVFEVLLSSRKGLCQQSRRRQVSWRSHSQDLTCYALTRHCSCWKTVLDFRSLSTCYAVPQCERFRKHSKSSMIIFVVACQPSLTRRWTLKPGALNETIWRALVSANVPAKLEPKEILKVDQRRPDGLALIPWKHGNALTWDVTIVDTLALTHVVDSAERAGSAAEDAERKKTEKYSDSGSHYLFSPVGFKIFGTWGPSATDLLGTVGKKLAEQSGESRSLQFLKQRIFVSSILYKMCFW